MFRSVILMFWRVTPSRGESRPLGSDEAPRGRAARTAAPATPDSDCMKSLRVEPACACSITFTLQLNRSGGYPVDGWDRPSSFCGLSGAKKRPELTDDKNRSSVPQGRCQSGCLSKGRWSLGQPDIGAPAVATCQRGLEVPCSISSQAFFDSGDLALEPPLVEQTQPLRGPPHAFSPRVAAVQALPRPAIGAWSRTLTHLALHHNAIEGPRREFLNRMERVNQVSGNAATAGPAEWLNAGLPWLARGVPELLSHPAFRSP